MILEKRHVNKHSNSNKILIELGLVRVLVLDGFGVKMTESYKNS